MTIPPPAFVLGMLLFLPLHPSASPAQVMADSTAAVDTTIIVFDDSLRIETDSLASRPAGPETGNDSTGRMRTPSRVGTLDRDIDSAFVITPTRLEWMDYRSVGEILAWTPGVTVRDQFRVGSYSALAVRGEDWRTIAVMMNGRPMNDPSTGTYNPYFLAPEFADRIEVVTGLRAFLYGMNSTGASINMVTKNYNSNRPFSKINFAEGGYNEQYSDGTFSQNISRKLNVTFGFQHQSTDPRFDNSAHLAWNVRSKIRYEVTPDMNLILSEYYTSTNTRLNGGVDVGSVITQDAFLPQLAPVRSSSAYEKVNRHDVDCSLVGMFFGDTAQVTTLSFYYSNSLREYRNDAFGSSVADTIPVAADHRSSWMGILLTQNLDLAWQRLSIGGNVELRQIEGSPNLGRQRDVVGSVWGKEEIRPWEGLSLAGYIRFDHYLGQSYLGAGADVHVGLGPAMTLYGGLSFSHRLPTYQELFWTGSSVGRTGAIEAERHRNVEAGALFNFPAMAVGRVAFFHRVVSNPLVAFGVSAPGPFTGIRFFQSGSVTTSGIEATVTLFPWVLTIEGTGTFLIQEDDSLKIYPRFTGVGGIYYWNQLFAGSLDLKVGFRGRVSTAQDGEQFNPEALAYASNPGPGIHTGSSVDAVLTARIGDATIHLLWENLLNNQYFLTPFYPVYDRAVRFGISWQFLD